MREIPIDKEKHSQETLDVELITVDFPLLAKHVLSCLSEDAADLVLVESVM
jgi:hypothetical protein